VRDLPRGTVTFLFTDIEGSTRLLHELGADGYAESLAAHRAVLRDAFARNDGVEVDTQGDAFFVAFPTAPAALAAAREAQEALEVPVRMGIHTGTPLLTDEGYVGADVHRAARIAAAGHGRQVLVSASTAALLEPDGLRDLGEHRLKDLSAPERIFQLGAADFPPLKTLYRTNLPIPATPFVGRARELEHALELLGRADVRLLTLTGAGGSGKTRLALQAAGAVAGDYPHGVWWVPLAPLARAAEVAEAAARALGGGTLEEAVGDRTLLLLLDNFEHVVDAAADVGALIRACPNVVVLVSSRERLQVAGEHVYEVPVLARAEARDLFVARARAARPAFEPDGHVDELCAHLDDLPLALELAAARTSLLTTGQLLDRLGGRLDLLRGGRDSEQRQRTLRATIEWSYDLLESEEQRVLAALSVFRGGWTLEAAERVCQAELEELQSLADKSLVRRWEERRHGMLETIREFAAERLEAGGAEDETRRRHARFFCELAEEAGLWPEAMAAGGGSGGYAVAGTELPNIRAALEYLRARDTIVEAARLAVALENLWVSVAPAEAAVLFRELLESGAVDEPSALHARLVRCLGDFTGGVPYSKQALEEYRRLGDDWGTAHMLHRLSTDAARRGDLARARRLVDESLALDPSAFNQASSLLVLGGVAWREGRVEEALELTDRAAAEAASIDFVWWQVNALADGAEFAFELGRLDDTQARLATMFPLARAIGDLNALAYGLATLASVEAARGRAEEAGLLWGAVEAESERGTIGKWEHDRAEYEDRLATVAGADFERGRARARALSLDEAVGRALSID
jgi:predicted ATPase